MSDEEILRLIAETPSNEWTEEQIELVRSRLTESPEICRAMTDRLRLDDLLAVTFDTGRLNPQKVVAAASQIRPMWRKSGRRRWPWGVALVAMLATAGLAWQWWPEDGLLAFGNSSQHNEPRTETGESQAASAEQGEQTPGDRTQSREIIAKSDNEKPVETDASKAQTPVAEDKAPASAEKPLVIARVEPWDRPEHLGAAPRPYSTVGFINVGDDHFTPRSDELRRWLTGLPGIRLDVQERDVDGRRCGTFEGAARLAVPWREDAILRLALRDANKLKLFFWRGERGVMLHYHEDRRYSWAAYVVGRDSGETKPRTLALATTDDERAFRTSRDGRATLDVFWRADELVLARGGIELLTAPLEGAPTEVLFDGRACFLGLTMTRVSDIPARSEPRQPTVVENSPAWLDWKATTPTGAQFELSKSGYVELTARKANTAAHAYTAAVPGSEVALPQEIICRIDDATPGASVFLADGQGRQTEVLRYMHSRATGGVGVWIVAANDGRIEAQENLDSGPVPLVGPTTWLRILTTSAGTRLWLGVDGVHWASPWSIREGIAARRLGISLWPGEELRRIRVGQLAWRELSGLAKLAPRELIAIANTAANAESFRGWRDRVRASTPENVDAAVWRRASAIATLSAGTNGEMARYLMDELVEGIVTSDLPVESRVSALDDLSLVCNVWDDPQRAKAIMDAYASLAGGASDELSRPYTVLATAMIRSPLRSRESVPVDALRLARSEVLRLVDAGEWGTLDQLCRTLRFRADGEEIERLRRDRADGESLVDWAQMLARRHVKSVEGKPRPAMHPAWREPLVEQFNTEAFNVLSEFHAAVEGKAYGDAAETIATAGGKLVEATDTLGVLPDAKQEGLYVSLRVAVEQAMRDHPGLESAMQERFGPTALLRVRKAIADGNVRLIEAATLQYHGTTAADEAHVWLGNRALSVGEFARAVAHFNSASESGDQAIATEARNRARLAAALTGQRVGGPATSLSRIGDASIAAGEFERVIAQLLARVPDSIAESDPEHESATEHRVEPAEFAVVIRGKSPFSPIGPPREFENLQGPRVSVDWFARGTAMATRGNTIVINGRTSAAAFDTERGVRLWEATLRGPSDGSKVWPANSSHPLMLGERALVRWIAKDGPVLVCLDLKDGRQVWQGQLDERQVVVGDPFFAQGGVSALAARPDALGQSWQLSLVNLDKDSGAVSRSRPLVRLGESWRALGVCRATLDRDRLFVSLGSVVVCCDLSGQVHWVRSLPHVPASVDSWCYAQSHDAPIVANDRVFVAAPTVRKIVCLEAASGRMVWQRSEIDVVALESLAVERLVVRNADGLVGLDARDGNRVWRFAAEEYCEVLAGPEMAGSVVVAVRPDAEDRRRGASGPKLVWLDPASGKRIGEWASDDWKERSGQFGPVAVSSQGRLWGLRGQDPRGEAREVVELFPPGVPIPMPPVEIPKAPPVAVATDELQKSADKTLAGWSIVSGSAEPSGTLIKHLESDDTVLVIADAANKVVFSRQASIAAQSRGRLRIKAGYAANQEWQIRVTAGERVLLEKTIGGKTEPGWERFELELAPLAGQAVMFEVTATSPDGKPRRTLWKRLEVTP